MKQLKVRDIPSGLQLISDSQDIDATLESIGKTSERDDIGCMFVEVLDGDYGSIYAIGQSVPWLDAIAWQLQ